ncbi:Alpha/Beta hydrolase protein [Xylogone sp. PMI_703]|nr:Alpha/Beta hydrolase protein [Xylogone sp. PMI_703]
MAEHISQVSSTHPSLHIHLPSSGRHTHALIMLHGTSTSGPELAGSFSSETNLLKSFPSVKFIFPTASLKPCTVFRSSENPNPMKNCWFNIHDFSDRTKGESDNETREGMKESLLYLSGIVRSEIEELEALYGKDQGAARVGILGFSQGSAIAMSLILSGVLEDVGLKTKLGGIVGLSGWLPYRRQIDLSISSTANETDTGKRFLSGRKYLRDILDLDDTEDSYSVSELLQTSIFMGHGEDDRKVKLEWAKEMRNTLVSLDLKIQFKSYELLEHWFKVPDEIDDLSAFLRGQWGETSSIEK